ncbi:hypothetical protein CDAR_618111 [Caerostris darwini]|uniref:Uncharacterized protein n=1 Tax=Caerostris darwini TaxID=1538125 RepID=A0AAV4U8K9_9ARAC|nr:hypothetical protein CDAR_618111 [Caerostris darwini]
MRHVLYNLIVCSESLKHYFRHIQPTGIISFMINAFSQRLNELLRVSRRQKLHPTPLTSSLEMDPRNLTLGQQTPRPRKGTRLSLQKKTWKRRKEGERPAIRLS